MPFQEPWVYPGISIDVYFFLVVLIVKMLVIINPKITKMGHEDDIDPIK